MTLVCYLPSTQNSEKFAIDQTRILSVLEKISENGVNISLVTDNQQLAQMSSLKTITIGKFPVLMQEFLFDVFISIGDLAVFNEDINAKVKILMTHAMFDESEQELLKSQLKEATFDYFLLTTKRP